MVNLDCGSKIQHSWAMMVMALLVILPSLLLPVNAEDGGITVASTDMTDSGTLSATFACSAVGAADGLNSPQLSWSGGAGTPTHYAIIMHDEFGANTVYDVGADWAHWVAYNIPATTTDIAQGDTSLTEGINTWGEVVGGSNPGEDRYRGPCPPTGIHNYYFTVYGYDGGAISPTGTGPGGQVTAGDVLTAINANITDQGDLQVNFALENVGLCPTSPPGFDAHWSMENTTDDVSGNGHNLQAGTVTYSTDGVRGTSAASFNGTSDFLQYSDGAFLNNLITNFTYSFWVKPDDLVGDQRLLDEGGSVNGAAIRLNGNNLNAAVRENSVQINTANLTFPNDNEWHHVALVYANGDVTLYLDGTPTPTVATGFGALGAHGDVHSFGRTSGADAYAASTGRYYGGLMDEIYHYPAALTAGDVEDLVCNLQGVVVSDETLTINENGGDDTFTIVLDTQPISDVVIDISSNDTGEATVTPTQLTFTNANWDTAQIVTVTGVDDAITANDTAVITVSVNDAGSHDIFDDIADQTVNITLTNDDVQSPGGLFTDLELWFKADAGTSTTINGAVIAQWDNSVALSTNHATQAGGGSFATYSASTHNFNPSVYFPNGDNGYFATDLDAIKNSDYNLIAILERDNSNTFSYFLGTNASRLNGGLHFGYRGNTTATLAQYANDVNLNTKAFNDPGRSISLLRGQLDQTSGKIIYELRDAIATSETDTVTAPLTGGGAGRLGRGYANHGFEGHISEAIVYSSTITDAEFGQIESYLALKYGMTLDQTNPTDYIASDGTTTMWVAADNAGYNQNIFGLGRDDRSGLNQKVSRSNNAGAVVTVALDDDFTSPNNDVARTTSHTNDKQFLVIANNGAEGENGINPPPSYLTRTVREWKVDLQNFNQNVNLKFEGYDSDWYLFKDTDNDFTAGATLVGQLDASGEITGVTFTDGEYFILANPNIIPGPGGVKTDLGLWLKADAGTDSIGTSWVDQSREGNDYITVAGPTIVANSFNYNPAVEILNGGFDAPPEAALGNEWTTFFISKKLASDINGRLFDGHTSNHLWGYWNTRRNSIYLNRNPSGHAAGFTSTDGVTDIHLFSHVRSTTGALENRADGKSLNAYGSSNSANGIRIDINQGSLASESSDAHVGEMIVFNASLSPADVNKVESYLAIKYGITLDNAAGGLVGDYSAADGTLLWDASNNAAYHNYVTGIGRDDASDLEQLKSTSSHPGGAVTIDKGASFGSDGDFILWGNNAETGLSTDVDPASFDARLSRVWKVAVTGTPGAVDFAIDLKGLGLPVSLALSDYALLIDSDGTFATDATAHTAGASLVDGILSFTGVSFNDGDHFTIAADNLRAPGSVASNLRLWLKADSGVTGVAPVSNWQGQWNAYDATVPGNGPDLVADGLNFNPTLDFTRANSEHLSIVNGILGTDAYSDMWVYYVYKANSTTTNTVFNENLTNAEYLAGLNSWGPGNLTYYHLGNTSTGGGGGRIFGATGNTLGQFSMETNGISSDTDTPAGTRKSIYSDGELILTNDNHDATVRGNNNNFYIGGRWAGANNYYLDGQIAEIAVYTDVPTPLEQEKVQSYLAIKYGLTKNSADNANSVDEDERDYFASDGTVIWDASANTDYHSYVAGIGRDDASGLTQQKSKSSHQGGVVTLDKGAGFGSDGDFIVWGSNAASSGTSTDVDLASFDARLNRVWKVAVTGSPGAVDFTIDLKGLGIPAALNASDYALIVDDDGTFASGAAVHTTGASINNGVLTFTGVTFSDGDFFTIAAAAGSLVGPGDVFDNLVLWVKADHQAFNSGTTPANDAETIDNWGDASGNGFDLSQSAAGSRPVLKESFLNFNPGISFDGVDNYLRTENALPAITDGYSGFVVMKKASTTRNRNLLSYQNNTWGQLWSYGNTSGNNSFSIYSQAPTSWKWNWDGTQNITTDPQILSSDWFASGDLQYYANGTLAGEHVETNLITDIGDGSRIILGARGNSGSEVSFSNYFDGEIAEAVYYKTSLSPVEQQKVRSYLGVKYGLTLGESYLDSDGVVIWGAAANATYHNNVTGIGRDDNSVLDQRRSKSAHSGGFVTMDKGAAFGSDRSFIIWGNDTESGTSTDVDSANFDARLSRVWKVAVTGTPGIVNFSIDLKGLGLPTSLPLADYALLVDSDGSFATGATEHTTGASLVGGVLSFTGVSFNDGDYFTIAANNLQAPGSVSDKLRLWLKADAGVTGVAPVSNWQGQWNSFDATVPGNGPDLVTDGLNFNPTLDFTGANSEHLSIDNGILGTDSYSDMWVYYVSRSDLLVNNTVFNENLAGAEYFAALNVWSNRNTYYQLGNSSTTAGGGRIVGGWGGVLGEFNLWTAGISNGNATPNGTKKIIARDGNVILANNNNDNTVTGNNRNFYIGGRWAEGTTSYLDGQIAELIVYTDAPTPLEQEKVQTYLAVKYGLTKNSADNGSTAGEDERDFFASDGTVIWDASANTAYHHDIAGIGRDDKATLGQIKSASANPDAVLTILAEGESTDDSNASANYNFTDLGNLEFLLWGNDDGSFDRVYSGIPAGIGTRVERIWRVQETGDVGTTSVTFDLEKLGLGAQAANSYRLLVDTDTDFSDATTITGDTLVDRKVTFTGVNLNNGEYFTIAAIPPIIGNLIWSDFNENGTFDAATEIGLSNVTVELYKDDGASAGTFDGDETLDLKSTTDANGNYTFAGFTPGDYWIVISDDNGVLEHASQVTANTLPLFLNVVPGEINNTYDFGFDLPDTDGDGIPDDVEGAGDSDGDGTPDYLDLDSDNDGISDADEANDSDLDSDNDGITDSYDVDATGGTDSNGNGIDDSLEGGSTVTDTDMDGIPDTRDADSDGDGIPDAVEGTTDTDADGTPNYLDTDSDNDGIDDAIEAKDLAGDSDGDGITDSYDVGETGGTDTNNDGVDDAIAVAGVTDSDDDSIPDQLDFDSDSDGIPDALEGNIDTDGDSTPDYLDLDSDNDGISDSDEASDSDLDSDVDGITDSYDVDATGGTDANNDGIDDAVAAAGVTDTDGDSTPDFQDMDSDGDGIPDALEGNIDTDNDGDPDYLDLDSDNDGIPDDIEIDDLATDTDSDGITDSYDVNATGGTDANNDGIDDAITVADITDTDGDGISDQVDVDSDNDGIPDALEGSTDTDGDLIPNHLDTDSDNDGIDDAVEVGDLDADSDNDGITDSYDVDATGGTDANNDGIDDAVTIADITDTDGDGISDQIDFDSDGDGIPDALEGSVDTDGDGTPDYLDLDSDNDGILDDDEINDLATDGDLDGITDSYDVDATGGIDANNDGIDDAVTVADITGADTDGDGISNQIDFDSDGDGIPDALEGTTDTDGDGIPDYLDLDSDNDGIDDADEVDDLSGDTDGDGITDSYDVDQTGGVDSNNNGIDDSFEFGANVTDTDGDGTPDNLDADSDGDGIPDALEGNNDTDGDGIPDYLDLDSDNDGIDDATEAVDLDADNDGDGITDSYDVDVTGGNDTNNDGIDDAVAAVGVTDTDGDGTPDFQDQDSDNDGIKDLVEGGGIDVDNDGMVDGQVDANGDGLDDNLAIAPLFLPDSDNDGMPDYIDFDSDSDGIPDALEGSIDTDGDSTPDYLDLDSDNDGISDADEIDDLAADTDSDGITDSYDVDATVGTDANNDGIDDAVTVAAITDTDGDGISDQIDFDSDGDGIPDALEGTTDTDGDGIPDYHDLDSDNDGIDDDTEASDLTTDADGDGITDSYDVGVTGGIDTNNDGIDDAVAAAGVIDSDADGAPDFQDLDSDNDGINDLVEGGGIDVDNDGLVDGQVDANNDGLDDNLAITPLTLPDTDGDGFTDQIDLDSDGDGVSDAIEGNVDSDNDSISNYLDLDSDNDGLYDLHELGVDDPANLDSDNDGRIDDTFAIGANGLADVVETSPDSDTLNIDGGTAVDTDGDGYPDFLDLDSDNDGIPDVSEIGSGNDPDGDGLFGTGPVTVDANGVPDGGGFGSLDTDQDGIPNQRDLDSDNDGIKDLVEGGGLDVDNDGMVDGQVDVNGDGLDDNLVITPLPLPDTDGDGFSDHIDFDSDGDGIPDALEGSADTDGDGTPDYLDLDSDNDGISDATEANDLASDSDGDGISDSYDVDVTGGIDANNDGIDDAVAAAGVTDSDGDGTPDFQDLDSDGDGIPDALEGNIDTDTDGTPDYLDLDGDNDGIPDALEGSVDSDGDSIIDALDLDSDNDGLYDLYELGVDDPANLDRDNDGRIDDSFAVGTNGLADVVETNTDSGTLYINGGIVVDTDGDGNPDYLDLDSDNDGIPDVSETGSGNDPDGDGLFGTGLVTVDANGVPDGGGFGSLDTDQDGIPNQRDLDADDDGVSDLIEGGGIDSNNDGLVDAQIDGNGDGLDDTLAFAPLPLPDSDGDGLPDFRDANDVDNDGITDSLDIDDDNDGIPDSQEGDGAIDSDGDGIADSLDLDSDNDGMYDLVESGVDSPLTLDADNDGRIDATENVGSNGLADAVETSSDSDSISYNGGLALDTDNDGIANFRDLDSDDDGIFDVIENGGSDPDEDGVIGERTPSVDGNGVPAGAGLPEVDADGNGVADYLEAAQGGQTVRTGVNGVGAFGIWFILLLLLLPLRVVKRD